MRKPLAAALAPATALAALLALGGCLQATPAPSAAGPGPDGETLIAADRLLLVYPASGVDTPPGGGVIRACTGAATGLCVIEVDRFSNPLLRAGDGWQFDDSAGNTTTLAADGTGQTVVVGGGRFAVIWFTQAWGR